MIAIIGLGNPGKDYAYTRHNVGIDTIDIVAKRNNIILNKIKFKSVYGEGFINNEKVLLVKPQTYMNNSGIAVRELRDFYKLPVENIIVIVDDVDIGFAQLRIRKKGSAGTHNGLKSIIYHLQDDNFPRIKIGIGKPMANQDLANFVLSKFSKPEREEIEITMENAALSIEEIIKEDIDMAMNKFN